MPMLVYVVKFSITELVGVILVPCGPVHMVFMVTGTSTLVSNTTIHDRFIDDPAVISNSGGRSLRTSTVDGAGTKIL